MRHDRALSELLTILLFRVQLLRTAPTPLLMVLERLKSPVLSFSS